MNDFPLSELEAERKRLETEDSEDIEDAEQKRFETEDSEDIEDAEQMKDRGKPNVI